jgi:hypothetical protein
VRLLPLIIFFTSSLLGIAEEDFPVLSLQRKKWEEARSSAEAKVDKSYLSRLEELKKDSVKKGDLDAARAFDKAIKGEAKGDEEEPATLTKLRETRDKALEAAFKPVDKQYWEDLKLLKGFSQREGDLEKMELVVAEINKVLAPYKQESPEKGFKLKPGVEPVVSLVSLSPLNGEKNSRYFLGENEASGPNKSKEVFINQKPCNEYIYDAAPSELKYLIPSHANWFTAIGGAAAGGEFKFIVKIDNAIVFESNKLSDYKNNQVEIKIKIPKESKVIELIIDDMGSKDNDHSLWAYPNFRSK